MLLVGCNIGPEAVRPVHLLILELTNAMIVRITYRHIYRNSRTMDTGTDGARFALLHNLKTGNIVVDMAMSLMVCGLVNWLMSRDFSCILGHRNFITRFFSEPVKSSISLSSCETRTFRGCSNVERSPTFVAVLEHIRKGVADGENDGLREVMESYSSQKDMYYDSSNDENENDCVVKAFYVAAQKEPFSLKSAPEVRYRMTTVNDDSSRGGREGQSKDSALTTHQLVIESTILDISQLQAFVDKIHNEYVVRLENKCHERLHVFVYEGVDSQFNLMFKTYPFDTTCSLDTMFFDDKAAVLRQMDFFVGNRKWYEEKGKPWTFGVCTHGEPGCGKTTFEKAVCKHLNRHMIVVDISRIQSQQEADTLFFSREIAGRAVPYDKRVYVFPDIDRQTDLLYAEEYKRGNPIVPKPKVGSTVSKEVKELAGLLRKKDSFMAEPVPSAAGKTPMNLSKLLNILDGVPERTGQIIIMSANHPERLDDAITRPGRVDTIIRFGKASGESSKKIVETFFDLEGNFWDDLPGHEEKMHKKKTPAEVFQICSQADSAFSAIKRISQEGDC